MLVYPGTNARRICVCCIGQQNLQRLRHIFPQLVYLLLYLRDLGEERCFFLPFQELHQALTRVFVNADPVGHRPFL